MEKGIRILAVLLGVQVLLAVTLWVSGTSLSATPGNTPLLALKGKTVDRLTLEAPAQAQLTLAKSSNVWRLPEHDDFPADSHKIEQLLTRLEELKQGTPVATSAGAQERFKVSDKHFERRITLANGGNTLATLYLGTSVGTRETHAREAGEKAVHAVRLAMYEVPMTPKEWEDKTVLQIPKDQIAAIDVGGLHLERTPTTGQATAAKPAKNEAAKPSAPAWQAAGATQTIKSEAVDKLAGLLAKLRIGAVLGEKDQSSYGLKTPKLTLKVTRKNGQTVEYRLGEMTDKKEQYVLKASNRDDYFQLPSYTAEPLIKAAKPDALFGHTTVAKTTAPKK